LGSGVIGSGVRAFSLRDADVLFVGGNFGAAGGQPSSNISAYDLRAREVFRDGFE